MRALLAGELELAEEFASDALAQGAPSESVTAREYYAVQSVAIRREAGSVGEVELAIRQLIEINTARPAWRAALTMMLWETGDATAAQAQLSQLAARAFADVPPSGDWLTTLALAAEACAGLEDTVVAPTLYELLLPYARSNVVIGVGAVCLGSVATYLGMLATTLGDAPAAAEHFQLGLTANAALRAPVCVAHTQIEYARTLGPSRGGEDLVQSAERAAEQLGLGKVARRASELRSVWTGAKRRVPRTLPSPSS
jgi:hypothetical protein